MLPSLSAASTDPVPGRWLVAVAVPLALVLAPVLLYAAFRIDGPHAEPRTVMVSPGTPLSSIASRLQDAGVIRSAWLFEAGARMMGIGHRLQAGEYAYPAQASMWKIADAMVRGDAVLHRVTLVEGSTARQAAALLNQNDVLGGSPVAVPPEGSLFPDTYLFRRGSPRAAILDRAQSKMTEVLAKAWEHRSRDLPYRSPEEALVLASMIEAETALHSERHRVAAVFVNRLRRNMRLQSDSTVLYGMDPGSPRTLFRSDLRRPHPWNTYRMRGLPPTPIGNPSLASIQAAMRPADTDDLYFVANGFGGHSFAATLRQHNRNVARWKRLRDRAAAEVDTDR